MRPQELKVLPDALQTYDNTLDLCHKQSDGATPLTIHSQQEQDFLSDLLFTKYKILDNVWIGAKVNNKKVTWVDGSKDDYTNWESGEPSNVTNDCVEMESAIPNTGKWVDVPCLKRNIVVCQTTQWSLDQIKHMIDDLRATVLDLSQNTVPIGYIHIQLPNQPEPKTLWPKMDWDNITPSYAGLFFRAEGGNSTKFNEAIQEQDSPRLVMVDNLGNKKNYTSDWPAILLTMLIFGEGPDRMMHVPSYTKNQIQISHYDNALDLCHKQSIDATPLTIHSQQEQDFFSDLLFTKHKIADNVWIGAKVSNKKVTWVDGSRDEYTNWETGEPTNATIDCVEMESAIPNTGKWVDVPCVKKNQVVCQTIQWSLDQIKHMIDELKANQTN
ncbi:unnamed protein product [Oppiella nova]|uniref:C-type lectin domain-containing protein n=1 Tax=Oppiella nova TaxID=334625 RepID=A0A7R9QLU2_9ACAR|nr:unnamed protein product [Oppiella nova]CAG2167545.1 unnamed protein product [Oppiella nova]